MMVEDFKDQISHGDKKKCELQYLALVSNVHVSDIHCNEILQSMTLYFYVIDYTTEDYFVVSALKLDL